ncbi:MAG: M16 family metallopeptidase [Anaerolineaceae bacterium]
MSSSVFIEKLDNGLSIFLKEIHSAPIISCWNWYRVGSRLEKKGYTGLSHWVEHMQFKGTKKFSGVYMDRIIAREGGLWNAFTHLDWTTYYETLQANKIDIALDFESERMQNSTFDEIEFESERTVILSEKEGKENDPLSRLSTNVTRSAFEYHPYRNEVIGEEEDLKRIKRDDLYAHYRKYYQPSNALIALAGDFETDIIFEKICKLYDPIPSNYIHNENILPEHTIQRKEEIEIHGPGDTTFMQIAYRSPAASDPDFFAYTILDSILTGPASLNMFGGGGTSNKTSRLYQNLVEKEFAVSVYGGLQATIDPHLYEITVIIHPEKKPEIVLDRIDIEINRLISSRVKRKEVEKAIKQATALFSYGLENITNQAFWLGYSEMFAKYDWFINYIDHLKAIQIEDIQRVAQKYLNPDHRVVGLYIPEKDQEVQV